MTTTAPSTTAGRTTLREEGRVVAIAGPVIDVEFPPHALPEINYAVEFDIELDGHTNTVTAEVAQQIGEGRVRCICMQPTDGLVRGAPVRNLGGASRSRWATPSSATSSTCSASRSTPTPSARSDDHWEIHRTAPAFDQLEPRAQMFETGHQGHRPPRAVRPGWQDRPVRRGRRGQDRPHPGDDQPGGPEHGGVSVFAGVGERTREGTDLWLEMQESGVIEKAALVYGQMDEPPGVRLRVAPGRADHGRVLPRRAEPGRAALRRQHLPLRPGRLGGLDPARPDALGRGLPAHPGRRDGRAAGADHLHQGAVDHLGPGGLRAGRRLHRPGPVHHLHPPRRHHRALPPDRRPRHLPGGGPAGVDLEHPGPRGRRRAPLRRGPPGPGGPAALQGAAGHHRHPRASTSSPRRTG